MNNRIITLHKEALLKDIIKSGAYQKGDFTLSSGAKSDYYLDMRLLTLQNQSLYRITSIIDNVLSEATIAKVADVMTYDSVGGPTIGADPIVGALLQKNLWNKNLTGFLIRPWAKDYGTKKLIEGKAWGRCMLVEDVVSSGGSLDRSILTLNEIGIRPQCIFSVVDRTGHIKCTWNNIPYFSIFYVNEIQDYYDKYKLREMDR